MPDASSATSRTNQAKEDVPKNIQERLAKNRIEREEKDYQELLGRSVEALQISVELQKSYAKQNKMMGEDRKKLDRLEKLAKKIRKDLGGDEMEDLDEQNPSDTRSALEALRDNAASLSDELKKSTRYSISVEAIESSNRILKLLELIKNEQN